MLQGKKLLSGLFVWGNMSLYQRKRWNKVRRRGKKFYLILTSMLAGFTALGTISLIEILWGEYDISDIYSLEILKGFALRFIIFALIGLLFGHFNWRIMEKKYHKKNR